jgi:UDP-N-acetylmuramoyl-L-alanyl-D-glutamate--2,6-diaminopimelate ligase
MLLRELLVGRALPIAAADLAIRGLTADSREVRPGFLFAALPGTKLDGASFIADAVRRGAVAVLADEKLTAEALVPMALVPIVRDANPRRALALAAARFYPHQPAHIAAVTGTNGKTSVTVFARQIWTALGAAAASVGTLGVIGPDGNRLDAGPPLTTPDPVQLHAMLDRLAGEGVDHVALEASSHGLDQYRLDGARIRAAAFTNLTRDHLDYHGTEGAYIAAKLRLFTEVMSADGIAIMNMDAPLGETFARAAEGAGRLVWRVGQVGKDIKILEARLGSKSQGLRFEVFGQRMEIELPLVGGFQASNALMAAGLVIACGLHAPKVFAALATLKGVPGRMQHVGDVTLDTGVGQVYVDYAHTPDALRTVLAAIRPHTAGRLHLVFGCGGDRDKGKRALMGNVAAELADAIIATDDNPRGEVPGDIRRAIMEGIPAGAKAQEIGDRASAIEQAVGALEPGDILLIAGKGHETGQIVGAISFPFDDAKIARRCIQQHNSGGARHG